VGILNAADDDNNGIIGTRANSSVFILFQRAGYLDTWGLYTRLII
jgi:hypothetical protein